MGGNASQDQSAKKFNEVFKTSFEFAQKGYDSRFGDVEIYKGKTEETYVLVKNKWCQSEDDFSDYISQTNDRKKINHSNLIRVLGVQQEGSDLKNMCGGGLKLRIYFEYYTHQLEREIEGRIETGSYFTQSEIFYMLDSLVTSGLELQKNRIFHGDLRPISVLLTPEGLAKVLDNGLIQSENSYIRALSRNSQDVFLSPLLLSELSKGVLNPDHNPFKSDIYSLGMTILEMATLEKSRECYNFSNYSINEQLLNSRLSSVQTRYSSQLAQVLRRMLSYDENLRPNFGQLHNELSPYRNQPIERSQINQTKIHNINQSQYPTHNQPKIINQPLTSNINQSQQIPLRQSGFHNTSSAISSHHITNTGNLQGFQPNLTFGPQRTLNNTMSGNLPVGSQTFGNFGQGNIHQSVNNRAFATQGQQTFNQSNPRNENERYEELDKKINEALAKSQNTIKQHGNYLK